MISFQTCNTITINAINQNYLVKWWILKVMVDSCPNLIFIGMSTSFLPVERNLVISWQWFLSAIESSPPTIPDGTKGRSDFEGFVFPEPSIAGLLWGRIPPATDPSRLLRTLVLSICEKSNKIRVPHYWN